jgi:hypothetical protein
MRRNIGALIILLSDSELFGCFYDIKPHTAELSTIGSVKIVSLCLKK